MLHGCLVATSNLDGSTRATPSTQSTQEGWDGIRRYLCSSGVAVGLAVRKISADGGRLKVTVWRTTPTSPWASSDITAACSVSSGTRVIRLWHPNRRWNKITQLQFFLNNSDNQTNFNIDRCRKKNHSLAKITWNFPSLSSELRQRAQIPTLSFLLPTPLPHHEGLLCTGPQTSKGLWSQYPWWLEEACVATLHITQVIGTIICPA